MRWLTAVVPAACSLLLSCASVGPPACVTAAAPSSATPLLWRASGVGKGVVYLFGSVHVGAGQEPRLGPAVDRALANAQELIVEADPAEVTPSFAQASLQRAALTPPTRLRDVVSPETHSALMAALADLETPAPAIQLIERSEPWLAVSMLVQRRLAATGYEVERGIDQYVLGRVAGRLPVVALETAEEQLALLDDLPFPVQELMLRDALERDADFAAATSALVEAWERGAEARLEALVFEPMLENAEFEAYYEAVFFARNEQMAARLISLARDGRTRFVVVGAGHMLGERGIPELLCGAGMEVARIAGGG